MPQSKDKPPPASPPPAPERRPVARLGLGKVTVIGPSQARRQGLRRIGWRLVDPISVRAVPKQKVAKAREAAGQGPGALPGALPVAPPVTVSNEPLKPGEELAADYIALHGRVDPAALQGEFKLNPLEIAELLERLRLHGLLLRGEAGDWLPAPDLHLEGAAGIVNSYLDPLLARLEPASARGAWARVLARISLKLPGRWHATKTSLAYLPTQGASTLTLSPQRKGMKIVLSDVTAADATAALHGTPGMLNIAGKAGRRGEPMAEGILTGSAFDPESLAAILLRLGA